MQIYSFSPQRSTPYFQFNVREFKFPAGESHIKLTNISEARALDIEDDRVTIETNLRSGDDIMKLFLAVDALRNSGFRHLDAVISYVPYARQDRVMVPGEPHSMRVFAQMINSLNFSHVYILDPHSDVAPALIRDCVIKTNHKFVSEYLKSLKFDKNEPFTLISPDAGAFKKVSKLASHLIQDGYKLQVVSANKNRDLATGEILSSELYGTVEGFKCLVVDDICDGGWTFEELGKLLQQNKSKQNILAVSHGIFSKGFDELKKYYSNIGTTDSYWQNGSDELLTVIPTRIC